MRDGIKRQKPHLHAKLLLLLLLHLILRRLLVLHMHLHLHLLILLRRLTAAQGQIQNVVVTSKMLRCQHHGENLPITLLLLVEHALSTSRTNAEIISFGAHNADATRLIGQRRNPNFLPGFNGGPVHRSLRASSFFSRDVMTGIGIFDDFKEGKE